ncbi:hypothetical protein [Mycobacterium leprae]|nr:hypothetical protein [Mycobacterium leprae]
MAGLAEVFEHAEISAAGKRLQNECPDYHFGWGARDVKTDESRRF